MADFKLHLYKFSAGTKKYKAYITQCGKRLDAGSRNTSAKYAKTLSGFVNELEVNPERCCKTCLLSAKEIGLINK